MSDHWHKSFVKIEALLFAGPVTFIAGTMGVIAIASLIVGRFELESSELAEIVVYLLPLPPLIAGWVLIARFIVQGRNGLNSSGSYLWWLAMFGVVIVFAAMSIPSNVDMKRVGGEITFGSWFRLYFRDLMLGLPAFVPLIHLLLLRTIVFNKLIKK